MFNIYNIKTAMNDALLEIGTDTSEPMCRPADDEINFPSSPDTPTGKKPYIDVSYPFGATTSQFGKGQVRQTMLMQFDVFGKAGDGTEQVETIVNSIINSFKKGRIIGDAKVDDFATQSFAGEVNGDYRVTLTLPFSYVVF